MRKKSIWAVVAGVLVIIVVTTLVDAVLHVIGVFPPMDRPLDDRLALLATSYRIVISIGGAWLKRFSGRRSTTGTSLSARGWFSSRGGRCRCSTTA